MKSKIIYTLILYLITLLPSQASVINDKTPLKDSTIIQIAALEKGDQCPDFEFSSMVNSKVETFKLSDLRGKIVILDFWATWCNSCVAAIPKLNELQEKFKDQIQIIGVTNQNYDLIKKFYKQRLEIQNINLQFPTVTNDQYLHQYFPHQSISHLVWIDKAGKVFEITESTEVTENNITGVINSQIAKLKPKTDRSIRTDVNLDEPFFLEKLTDPIYINEGVTEGGIRYRSVITHEVEGLNSISFNYTGRIIATNVLLTNLFQDAYNFSSIPSGEYITPFPSNKIFLEIEESNYDSKNLYCYEIVFLDHYDGPTLSTDEKSMQDLRFIATNIMKKDLFKWKGIYSTMIPRKMNALVLKMIDSSKINSSEIFENSESIPGNLGVTYKNGQMYNLKRGLWYWLQREPPLIDETNYFGPINMKLDCKLTNPHQMRKELLKYGLDLVVEERVVDVLVIKDNLVF